MLKKLLYTIILSMCVVSLAACGQNENPQTTIVETEPDSGLGTEESNAPPATPQEAFQVTEESEIEITGVWNGYTELDFKSFFTKGITNFYAGIEGVTLEKCEIFAVDGWNCDGFLDESTVTQENRAVSYVAYLIQKNEDEVVNMGYKFYMELTPDGVLSVKGAESFAGGAEYGDVYDEEEAKGILNELKDAI